MRPLFFRFKTSLFKKKLWLIIALFCLSSINTYTLFQLISPTVEAAPHYQMTIMIAPTGDSQYAGRTIDDNFERGIARQFTEELKTKLEQQYPGLRIIITHAAGESVLPLQQANFANRLNADLYLSIHFYQKSSQKPQLYIYHFSYGNDLCTKTCDLSFYPFEQAYLFSKEKTYSWVQQVKDKLAHPDYSKLFEVKGPFALPFKPLIGIKSPAIALEGSFKKSDDWHIYIDPVTSSLDSIIVQYKQSEKLP